MIPINKDKGRVPAMIGAEIMIFWQHEKKISGDTKSVDITTQQFCQRWLIDELEDDSFNFWLTPIEIGISFNFGHDSRYMTKIPVRPIANRLFPEFPFPELFRVQLLQYMFWINELIPTVLSWLFVPYC